MNPIETPQLMQAMQRAEVPAMSMHIVGAARALPFHSIGGMQAIAWDLFAEFARLGHRVTVITTRIPGRSGPFEHDGVRVVPIESARPEKYSAAWWHGSRTYAQSQLMQSADAVLSISSAAAGLLPLKREGLSSIPFLFQAHGTSWGEILSKWRTGKPLQWAKSIRNIYWLFKDVGMYRQFDQIVLVGDVIEQQFRAFPLNSLVPGLPRSVIRNGVDASVFRPDATARARLRAELSWPAEAGVLVFAARFHPQKGGALALDAFRELATQRPDARLLMIGGGEEESSLRARVVQYGLQARVHFTGAVQRASIPSLLAGGDAFVFPSLRQEGLPMNVLEALSCGLRPVCSESMRQVFDARLPIRYAEPTNIPALAACMGDALDERASPVSLLTPEYTLRHCAEAYLALMSQRKDKT